MGPHTQPGEGFHQDTRHFLTTPSCQAPTQIMPTSLQKPPTHGLVRGGGGGGGGGGEGGRRRGLRGL